LSVEVSFISGFEVSFTQPASEKRPLSIITGVIFPLPHGLSRFSNNHSLNSVKELIVAWYSRVSLRSPSHLWLLLSLFCGRQTHNRGLLPEQSALPYLHAFADFRCSFSKPFIVLRLMPLQRSEKILMDRWLSNTGFLFVWVAISSHKGTFCNIFFNVFAKIQILFLKSSEKQNLVRKSILNG
jgi:hypothetical protein